MTLLPYDVNSYLKTHASMTGLLTTLGVTGTLDIVPLNDPEPCDSSGSPLRRPFIRYYWLPNINSLEGWFVRKDRIRYYIMDRDYDRMMRIANTMILILNPQASANPHKIACSDGSNRIFHSRIVSSNMLNPNEAGGLAASMLEFELRYVSQPL